MAISLTEITKNWEFPVVAGDGSIGNISLLPAYEGGCLMKGPDIHLSLGQLVDFGEAMEDILKRPVRKLVHATAEDGEPSSFAIKQANEEEIDSRVFQVREGEDDPPTEAVILLEFPGGGTALASYKKVKEAISFAIRARTWMRRTVS